MPTPVRLVSLALVMALPLASCGSSRATVTTAEEQLRFGADMAERGLWSEAFFRFQQARQLSGGTDAKVLNNLAVASEALGKFDQALAFYKEAIALAPGEGDLKANYDRFVSFYESFRARSEEAPGGGSVPAAPPAPAVDAGSGNRPATPPGPPTIPPPSSPTGLEPPDVPPMTPPEPAPTPPSATASTEQGGHP